MQPTEMQPTVMQPTEMQPTEVSRLAMPLEFVEPLKAPSDD